MTKRPLSSSAGFTYIAALVMVVIVGIMAAKAVTVWSTYMQREREAELIYKGIQIRDGMRRFYGMTVRPYGSYVAPGAPPVVPAPVTKPNFAKQFNELKDLVQATDTAGKKHYVRQSDLLVKDPASGKVMEWAFYKDPSSGMKITGVFLPSEGAPIKQGNFPLGLHPDDFKEKKKYSDWVFICTRYPQPDVGGGSQKGANGTTPNGTSPSGTTPSGNSGGGAAGGQQAPAGNPAPATGSQPQ
jgi:Tfp pilus assembly protein PilE